MAHPLLFNTFTALKGSQFYLYLLLCYIYDIFVSLVVVGNHLSAEDMMNLGNAKKGHGNVILKYY